jgi:ABC-type glycerol-3-phosphate transport system substrate-binding protein
VDPRQQRIIWWHTYTGGWEEGLQAMVDQWNGDNLCEITIELRNMGESGDLRDRMAQAIASQHGPALIVGYQSDEAYYDSLGGLVDMTPYVDDAYWGLEESDIADFYPAFWTQPLHDGQRLGLPFNRALEVLYYNLTWAAELGFDQRPTTPDEFEQQACAAAQSNGDGTGGYVLRDNASAVAGWAFAFGGDFLDQTGAAYTFNTPALQGSLAMLKRLYTNGCAYFYTKGYPDPEFAARRALFTQGSSAGLYAYFKSLKKAKNEDQFAIIALPYTAGTPRMNGYGIDLIVPISSPEQQLAAWIFIKWITAPLSQAEWAKITGYLPVRASALNYLDDYLVENPQWAQAAALLPYAVTEPSLASYTDVRSEIKKTFTKIIQSKGDTLEDLLEKLTDKANSVGR